MSDKNRRLEFTTCLQLGIIFDTILNMKLSGNRMLFIFLNLAGNVVD